MHSMCLVFSLALGIYIWQSIDPWPSIICTIQPGIIPSSSEYDLILFPFVIVFKYYQYQWSMYFFIEIKATITPSKKYELVFCDLDPNWKDQEIKPIILNSRTEIGLIWDAVPNLNIFGSPDINIHNNPTRNIPYLPVPCMTEPDLSSKTEFICVVLCFTMLRIWGTN